MLGAAETDDALPRRPACTSSARSCALLTGSEVTDTSSGFRAMRVEVTETVRQDQVQYQTSELLIGAIAQGYRVVERPITMRKRMAGESKKGHNLLYGMRYARVILTHLVRGERRPAHELVPRLARARSQPFLPALRVARFVLAVVHRRGDARRRRPRTCRSAR